ncbi:hypothetical protein BT96DRAFT_711825 [Gymnopus androsaceus JB14]|uniref:Uncharacterized protein n=1 Tax=Gymnopus androsaceus JB14 TaxID=1447944 RepID=A0A6A4HNN2_9AGAR|nr:hypothetical protein BT96DRAFT_711825 [Gymnopus androsaceus JB14]
MAAATASVTVHPPSSPFASLLRRSRFATFDPQIRQTYYTPPEHASRGSWGLKRPLALRRRNAFISLPAPFEDRAQFIEWNRAEDEVRFIRRFEEMQVRPLIKPKTPWAKTLGSKNSSQWLIDSEFCYRSEGPEAEEVGAGSNATLVQEEAQRAQRARLETQRNASISTGLESFGKAGQGNYGHRRSLKAHNQISPNIDAMLPKEFERYVRRLRQLRPKFKDFLQQLALEDQRILEQKQWEVEQAAKEAELDHSVKLKLSQSKNNSTATRQISLDPSKTLYEVAQSCMPNPDRIPSPNYHRRFIEAHTSSQFAGAGSSAEVVIEQRPHQVGGLLYNHPTNLHTQLFATPQPGIVLQTGRDRAQTQVPESIYVASFGGLTPMIRKRDWGDKLPLLDHNSNEGVRRENILRSVAKMRMVPGSVVLEEPPLSVARNSSGLSTTRINADALIVGSRVMFSQTNPYKAGTMEYVALAPVKSKNDFAKAARGPVQTPIATNKAHSQNFLKWKKTVQDVTREAQGAPEARTGLLTSLKGLIVEHGKGK